MKRRVVVTGRGIMSSIGTSVEAVTDSLFNGKSGIGHCQEYEKMGLGSQVAGKLPNPIEIIGKKKIHRFMSKGAAFAYLSMLQAIEEAGLKDDSISNPRTGLIVGTGGGSPASSDLVAETVRNDGFNKLRAVFVPKCMVSSPSANLATLFGIKGVSFSLGSACATGAHCVGEAFEKIADGKQDIIFSGGADEQDWIIAAAFDATSALSRRNDEPQKASRPYDKDRDGFVISSGAGILVLEELDHALARGAKIYAEIIGYAATSDGFSMVEPSGEGAVRCMEEAIRMARISRYSIGYINPHGTSTPRGDVTELEAIKDVFGKSIPLISSTKSLTGHGLGATGVQELIYSSIMMEESFISASANIENLDPGAEGYPIVRERIENYPFDIVMSNSFGFGGTNAVIIMEKFEQ
jgi:3-oxoacyl-[acyl-carrier-protein] synthase I